MQKRWSILMAAFAFSALSVSAASAQAPQALANLARFFPADTPIFASVRADDAFVQSVNGLIDRVEAVAGQELIPAGFTLMQGFDYIINESVEGGTFENVIRSWLGDTVAFGVLSTESLVDDDAGNDNQQTVIALEVTDGDTAQAFIEEVVLPSYNEADVSNIETLREETFSVYEVQLTSGAFIYYALYADVLFVSSSDAPLPFDSFPAETLAVNDAFTSLVASLPAESYNMLAYLDLPTLITAGVESRQGGQLRDNLNLGEDSPFEALRSVIDSTNPVLIGATVQGEAALTLDIVQVPTQASNPAQAVNPSFAAYIPAGTPLVIHSTNLRAGYENILMSVRAAVQTANNPDFSPEQVEQTLEFARSIVQFSTNLDLNADILDWMTGDFALTLGLNDQFPDTVDGFIAASALPVDFALLIAATDSDRAQGVVEGLRYLVTNVAQDETSGVTVGSETVGDTAILTVTFDAPDVPFDIVLAAGADENVFALGTLNSVRAAFDLTASLADDPLFQEATTTILPNASQVWYFAGDNLQVVADIVESDGEPNDAQQIRDLLTLFHSSSISVTRLENGASAVRAVLTLP